MVKKKLVILFIKNNLRNIIKLDLVTLKVKLARSILNLLTIQNKKSMLLGHLRKKKTEDDENLKQ